MEAKGLSQTTFLPYLPRVRVRSAYTLSSQDSTSGIAVVMLLLLINIVESYLYQFWKAHAELGPKIKIIKYFIIVLVGFK